MDIAELGLSVRSDGVVVASNRLDRLDKNSLRAERSTKSLTSGFASMTRVLGPLAVAMAGAFSLQHIFGFQNGIAEVSTLVDTATFSMGALGAAALQQASDFGNVSGQVSAYYQIISAGAGSVTQATNILTAANKLAVGGVTDITTAADGLTSILNAYGDQVESATAVSDALFVGMKAGKTTIGELSGALGQVAPLAAQTGVGFDELVASISALTKGGIQTRVAVTGVRAILAAVVKPTSEAAKMAEQLGIDFSAAALESQGLAGFLDTLVTSTKGSSDQLAQLFGGVEALVPIMALTGEAGVFFNATMEEMAEKFGMTEEAYNKMVMTPGFQSGRVFSNLTVEAIKLGGALGEALVPAMKFVADHAHEITQVVGTLAIALGTYALAANGAAIATGLLAVPMALLAGPAGWIALGVSGFVVLSQTMGGNARAAALLDNEIEDLGHQIETAGGQSVVYQRLLKAEADGHLTAALAVHAEAEAEYELQRAKQGRLERAGYGAGNPAALNEMGSLLSGSESRIAELRQHISEISDQIQSTEISDMFAGTFAGLGGSAQDEAGSVGAAIEQLRAALGGVAETELPIFSGALAAANDNAKNLKDSISLGLGALEGNSTSFETLGQDIERMNALLAIGGIAWEKYGNDSVIAVARSAAGIFGSLATLSGGLSAAFEQNKALSVATAVLKGAESVASSFAAGSAIGGPPIGALYAGVAAITAAANVAAVAATGPTSKSISGGGGGSGSIPTPSANQNDGSGQTTHVTFVGSSFNVEEMAEALNEYTSDGGKLTFGTG